MPKIRIKVKKPYIAYPGSTIQQNYAEDLVHGYLRWDITSRDSYDVKFCALPNPKPFITIDWKGSVAATTEDIAGKWPVGTRFRVYSREQLTQRDVVNISSHLKDQRGATEVTFKTDTQINRDVLITGAATVVKDDLRNAEVLTRLTKEYHADSDVSTQTWDNVSELIKGYLSTCVDETPRNVKWSLRNIKFDNTFAYGDGNVVNFDALNGIVGIFGPNRSGKSSFVGSLMYTLFNGTDRGSVKNLHVINTRKNYCYGRAIVDVDGIDHVIERQTVKNETKKGLVHASTALNLFRMDAGEATDLGDLQRNDTEKAVRKLIGSPEDFLLTSFAAQDELKMFILHGSTKRRQVLSRFLDLDIFDKMYAKAKDDLNIAKGTLRLLPERDWAALDRECSEEIARCSKQIDESDEKLSEAREKLDLLRSSLAAHKDFTPVTKGSVDSQQSKVKSLTNAKNNADEKVITLKSDIAAIEAKIAKIESVLAENDLDELRKRNSAFVSLESSVMSLKHSHEKEASILKQQERSLKILDDIPCGDKYPSCKFIKDAYPLKEKVEPQRDRVQRTLEKLESAQGFLGTLKEEGIQDKIDKLTKLGDMLSRLRVEHSDKTIKLHRAETQLENDAASLVSAQAKLIELEQALKNEENEEVVSLRAEIDVFSRVVRDLDARKMQLATARGKAQTLIDKYASEHETREEVLKTTQAFELIYQTFSRRGIPRIIVASQLPIINAEIAKILQGIVDFTIELETDDESDSMEVYINYGDSRRLIELGSGMEKMISSVAIRVALINVSSLPKTDMFIIDEGFGALDESGVEACNRLLMSLKRHFKTVIVITHVEGVKDAADIVLEISKNEKDSKVMFN